jgi:hypothetical protein
MRIMEKTTDKMVSVIKSHDLPSQFGIVFDGWIDDSSNHYVALYAVFRMLIQRLT